ncbi:MAG: hypothetical protein PHO41_07380 [Eubacteriales bacterium]|nr:hypothetical protein [Eubacteriales bacterium]
MLIRKTAKRRWGLLFSVLLCAVAIVLALVLVGQVENGATAEQMAQLKSNILHAAVTCYAMEGRYPPSLTYLCDNYGVRVDTGRFYVTYDIMGDNIMPTVAVLRRGVWK